jgi:hypothetical protein
VDVGQPTSQQFYGAGAMVLTHRFAVISKRAGLAVLMGTCLGACAGLSSHDLLLRAGLPFGEKSTQSQSAPIEASELDPLEMPLSEESAVENILAVEPSGETDARGEGSSRVPLGSLVAEVANASTPLTESSQKVEMTTSNSEPPAPAVDLVGSSPVAEASTAQVAAQAAKPSPTPGSAQLDVRPERPRLHSDRPVGRGPKPLYEANDPPAVRSDETVIISSSSMQPENVVREFVPASAMPSTPNDDSPALGQIPLTAAEKNVIRRFETLGRLRDEDLITGQEYSRRRASNTGALLPYTHDPAAAGLGRSVPGTDAIVARLAALKRAFEMRAITAQQHALERTMILNALLPERPNQRDNPKPPPADVLAGAAAIGHLEELRQKGLISSSEFEAERKTIEYVLRTGTFPSQIITAANAQNTETRQKSEGSSSETIAESQIRTQITGPVLHMASFRSEASAMRGWEEVLARNSDILGELQPIIRRIDLGPDQGIFYRLMAGTFESVSAAEAACIQLKQNNQFCRASADGS